MTGVQTCALPISAVQFALTQPEPGIYNCVNPGSVTTYQIAEMMGLEKEWLEQDAFMETVRAPRSNCTLDTTKMQRVFEFKPAKDALYEAVKFINSIPL